MKKILLLSVIVFSCFAFTTVNSTELESTEKLETLDVPDCWEWAEIVETNICGSPGCSFEIWDFYYNECINSELSEAD